MIGVVHPDPGSRFSTHLDPGIKKAQDSGSGSATLTLINISSSLSCVRFVYLCSYASSGNKVCLSRLIFYKTLAVTYGTVKAGNFVTFFVLFNFFLKNSFR